MGIARASARVRNIRIKAHDSAHKSYYYLLLQEGRLEEANKVRGEKSKGYGYNAMEYFRFIRAAID